MLSLSIRSRLILLFTLQIVLIVVAGGIYLNWQLRQTLEDELSDKLESLAKIVALQIDSDLVLSLAPGDEDTRTYRNLTSDLERFRNAMSARRMFVFTRNQTAVLDTEPGIPIGRNYVFLPITQDEINAIFAGQTVNSTLFTGSDGRLYKTGFAPIYSNGDVTAALAVEGSAQTLEAIQAVRRDLLILGMAVLIGSVILGFLFSERITTPINRLKLAAQKITKGDYETSIQTQSSDEIGFLGQTMEEMRRAIVQRDLRQKAMLAGVAHEIRNPLGGIELFAGLLASELTDEKAKSEAQKIQKEVHNLKRIVTGFLDYARPAKPKKEFCCIREVFAEVQSLLAEELNGYEVAFREEQSNSSIWMDRQHLKQILLNLMKNAIEAIARTRTN
ncbi:HAMP domain-containing protein [candidate division KSB1 bacterium]|nr:HAMP domain-containing protein [candidate division KSB1 bacterium]NIR68832.1 HAMP domain-containing protein [candidate division KSB1 bacterium]NIS27196.1 HAMP domain-containing protein [candidate division KSB1 bacterium]NIT74081.1 HAMP domain-containing protein [candidate division KSB1 bacterium]NIU27930.1 HAMP domain-containing protein [candidate division KSB1 bacterium]